MFSDAPVQNPHFPIMSGTRWDTPLKHMAVSDQLFAQPIRLGDVEGSRSNPVIDISKPARPNHIKEAFNPAPKRRLFENPRDTNRLIQEKSYSDRFPLILRQREPSPVSKSHCIGMRESTKSAGRSCPQIDLNKPARKPIGCQSPIKSDRVKLFQVPRETMKYTEIAGSHPKPTFSTTSPPHDTMGNLIPNSEKLFEKPREIMKYSDVQGSHSKNQIDLNKPTHDLFGVVEPTSKKLFQESRDWVKLASEKGTRLKPRQPEAPEPAKPKLFEQPRETMKYQDVEGAHPAQFYPSVPRASPTFSSTAFA